MEYKMWSKSHRELIWLQDDKQMQTWGHDIEKMKESSKAVADLVGAITANVYMFLIIAVFIARILRLLEIARWIGVPNAGYR